VWVHWYGTYLYEERVWSLLSEGAGCLSARFACAWAGFASSRCDCKRSRCAQFSPGRSVLPLGAPAASRLLQLPPKMVWLVGVACGTKHCTHSWDGRPSEVAPVSSQAGPTGLESHGARIVLAATMVRDCALQVAAPLGATWSSCTVQLCW
jgi:hypothetical protein